MIVAIFSLLFHYDTDNHKVIGTSHAQKHPAKSKTQPSQAREKKTHRHHYRYPDPSTKKTTEADTTPTHPEQQKRKAKRVTTYTREVKCFIHESINLSPTNTHPAPRNSTLSPLTHPSASYLTLPLSISPQPAHLTKKKINTTGASHRISPLPHVATPTYLSSSLSVRASIQPIHPSAYPPLPLAHAPRARRK